MFDRELAQKEVVCCRCECWFRLLLLSFVVVVVVSAVVVVVVVVVEVSVYMCRGMGGSGVLLRAWFHLLSSTSVALSLCFAPSRRSCISMSRVQMSCVAGRCLRRFVVVYSAYVRSATAVS